VVRMRVSQAAGTVVLRIRILSGRLLVAQTSGKRVRVGPPVVLHRTLRRTTVQASAGEVQGVSGSPNGAQAVVLGRGAAVPRVGGALVLGASRRAPEGLLGVVTGVKRLSDGSAQVTTKPGTLEDAYSAFDAQINGTLGELVSADAGSAARAAVSLDVFDVSFSCDDQGVQRSITHHINLSELHVNSEIVIPSISNGGSGPFINFDIAGQPHFGLDVTFSGSASCTATATAKIPVADTGVLIEIGPEFKLSAGGAVNANMTWEPWVSYGFSRGRGDPSNNFEGFSNDGHTEFSGDATLKLSLALQAGISLVGRTGVTGTVGPEITGDVTANTSSNSACLTVNADVNANLTAKADVFFNNYNFQLGSFTFGHAQLYHGCTSSAPAPMPPAPTPPPSPAPATTVPATGPTLVYDGQTAIPPEEDSFEFAGDRSFNDWAEAAGEPAEVSETLPANITPDRCVVLLTNESLDEGQEAELAAYLRAGGTILAVGEHEGGEYATADETLSRFAYTLGVGLALNDDSQDTGPNSTFDIDPSPLTANVFSLGDNWVSTLDVSGAAQQLVGTADGEGTLVGAQTVGNGTFVMAGDSNLFTDDSQGYDEDDNGQFARDLCP
jgi:hypothetical protein